MKQDCIKVEGIVTNNLSNGMFEVVLVDNDGEQNGHVVRASLGSKIRMHNIRISTGDRVSLEMSVYDLTNGRIVYRHDINLDGTPNPMKARKATNSRKRK